MIKYFFILALLLIAIQLIFGNKINTKSNIILVLTDDQDVVLNGLFPMTLTQTLIGLQGMTFSNAFTSSPICCPSRGSIFSGLYAHNHLIKNNSIAGGCYGKYWTKNIEPKALPVLFENAGYKTFFAGKYLNEYYDKKVPPGWSQFFGLHGNSKYYNYTMTENGDIVNYGDEYLTDVLSEKIQNFIVENKNNYPFFAMVAPPAPHEPFTPAERHKDVFIGTKAPRTPNFNSISGPLEKHWLISSGKTISSKVLDEMDLYFRKRWESLLAVDEMIGNIFKTLEKTKQTENTYIVYTSDNGYHIGQFAQPFDKRQPYETDIKVPLLVRGPGIKQKSITTHPIALIDLLPTFLEWAEIEAPGNQDGVSFNNILKGKDVDKNFHRQILIEYWGEGNLNTYNPKCPWQKKDKLSHCIQQADCRCQDSWNNTYSCIRHFAFNVDKIFCEFQDTENFVEAYDLQTDIYQTTNLGFEMLPSEHAIYSIALRNLTICMGESCRKTRF